MKVWIKVACRGCNRLAVFSTKEDAEKYFIGTCAGKLFEAEVDSGEVSFFDE